MAKLLAICLLTLPALGTLALPPLPLRLYIDMNTLDAPDPSYSSGAALNASAVAASLAPLLAQAPSLSSAGFTGLVLQVTGMEDLLTYDRLGNGSAVWPLSDPHRVRAAAWQGVLGQALGIVTSHNLQPYLMLFDLMHPPALALAYNLSLHSPDLLPVLVARFGELFERLPALKGVLLYVADCWSPRGGYVFQQLWSSLEDLAATATLYHTAFELAAPPGAQLLFSLWTPPSSDTTPAQAWAVLRAGLPANLTLALHDSQGDFSVASPINALLAAGAAKDRRVVVGSDAFRQVDGWGRLLGAPVQQWADRLAFAAGSGAVGGMVYGDWSPGITWPDSGGSLQNWSEAVGPVSWRKWQRFRSRGLRELGLLSPAEAGVAVLGGLYGRPDADPWELLEGWAMGEPLWMSKAAAGLVAQAFRVAAEGWEGKYMQGVDRYAIEWQSVFSPKVGANAESAELGLLSLFANASLAQVEEANGAVVGAFSRAVGLVQQALGVNGSQASEAGRGLLLAAQKTLASGQLFCSFRAAVWVNHTLGVGECGGQLQRLGVARQQLQSFGELYEEEAVRWNLCQGDPALNVRPVFFDSELRSMAEWVGEFERVAGVVCG